MIMIRAAFLALFCAVAVQFIHAAVNKPTVKVVVTDTNLNSFDDLDVSANYEVDVNDDVVVGVDYEMLKNKYGPSNIYVQAKQDDINVEANYDTGSKEVSVEANYNLDGTNIGVSFKQMLEDVKVKAQRSMELFDQTTELAPTFNVADKTVDVEVRQSLGDKVNALVSFNQAFQNPTIEAACEIDEKRTFTPKLDVDNKKLTYSYEQQLENGKITADVDPADKLSVSWEDSGSNGDWTATADVGLKGGNPVGFSFTRNFKF
ncbi:unnamed protein product [Heterosigma akashiwo]|uniref:Uncharacterized protein n=1 Tax=Heterosigma akashiwo TaxID=2829 RepID=A0A6T5P7C3_HETAK|mmetsp:Transcript_20490/g.28224  ORF Transcript_20490/g.28224 Transcript_20490/m.28224 type:complete len:261 (+) Transcript_20490:63-845(+)|eukprot:CAMPEP_0194559630 /NCGR_PEP_ID=MMETSP0292-20121207/1111_1 /TAXON_ID=39354 /ORGANISM="Heterosigma akashiwo, Strain CCMP2393" /LENGTH=260 /DNA_ID=CAMNT_0039407603 /DNA_START=97 /DNA_END=879 /DNA_ORIENTATION=+